MRRVNRGEYFSNDKYATKNQVTRELGTALISDIWNEILTYRAQFKTLLTLRTVEKNRLSVVLTPKISDKIAQIERSLTRLMRDFALFSQDHNQLTQLRVTQAEAIVSQIADKYQIKVEPRFYAQLVSGHVSAISAQEIILVNYHRALTHLLKNTNIPLDVNYVEALSALFNGNDQHLYRKTETGVSKATINPIQLFVPVNQIHDSLDDLLAFIQSSSAPMFVKFVAVYYYFDYIKPFEYYSEELAVLFAKGFLQTHDLQELAVFLNLETVLAKNYAQIQEVMYEVKMTNDLTYLVDYMTDLCALIIEELNESIFQIKRRPIIEEQYSLKEEKAVEDLLKEEAPLEITVANGESAPLKPEELKEPDFVPFKVAEDVNPTYKVEEQVKDFSPDARQKIETKLEIAIESLPVGLTEHDAQKIERHLMEMDPSLSRAEAYFYARHCTMGKYYTISQFKNEIGCAYETARTSMEHLAASGYYRKEKFKNKFIYTPIRLKNK